MPTTAGLFAPDLLQQRVEPRPVELRQGHERVVGRQDQVGPFVVHVEDERRPIEVEVLLAQVAVHERQPTGVALRRVRDQGGGDPDLFQLAAEGVALGLGVPACVAVVVEQLAGRHPAKLFDAAAEGIAK
jgi:hypothetical protein